MNRVAKIAIGIAAAGVVLAVATGASAGSPELGDTDDTPMGVRKTRIWNKLVSIGELDNNQRLFLMLWAYGEGGYSPFAHNDSASERAASSQAADNNPTLVARAIACGIDDAKLRTGSWGTFQRLAPYVASDAFEIFGQAGCPFADPTRLPTNLNLQIAGAIETARDLQGYQGWIAYPTAGNLRLGTGSPARMGYISDNADRLDKYRKHAAAQGLGGIVDAQLARFPSNVAAIYERLRSQGPA